MCYGTATFLDFGLMVEVCANKDTGCCQYEEMHTFWLYLGSGIAGVYN